MFICAASIYLKCYEFLNFWNFINIFLFLVDDTHVDARQCRMNNTIKVYVILNYPK